MKRLLVTIRKNWLLLAFSAFMLPTLIFSCTYFVGTYSEKYLFEEVHQVPNNDVGLVLGTSKYLKGGGLNPYFVYRMEAAAALYHAGKIKDIVVSGDNGNKSYNEPREMYRYLLQLGIPKEDIYMDFAGFRTLDSVIRCQKVFGQSRFTIISQPFHNERAVFIGREHGIEAVAFNAKDVSAQAGFKTTMREWFARVKAVLDIYVTDEAPRFLGDAIRVV